jgi:hypothetical protein
MQLKKAGGPEYSQQKEKKGKFTVEVFFAHCYAQ